MANNNFFLNNDPLLFNDITDRSQQYNDFERLRQQPIQAYDLLGELDDMIKSNADILPKLQMDVEFANLNESLQSLIQNELMSSVRWKINTNSNAISNMKRQIDIIKRIKSDSDSEQRKNLEEINDYIKNYSSITFDEYKRAKQENNHTKKEKK